MERTNKKHTGKRTFVSVRNRFPIGKTVTTVTAPRRFVAKGVNSVSRFQPPRSRELKFVDTSSVQSPAIAGTGTLSATLCSLAVGSTASQRVGNELTVKSLEWRQAISLATTTGNGAIRTVIVWDKSPNGVAPTISGAPATDMFNQDNINAQMFLGNRDRYIVLQDILTPALGLAGPAADYQKGYMKMSLPQVYNAGTAGVASMNTGNVVAVTWASPGFAVAAPTVTLQTRFRYEDA